MICTLSARRLKDGAYEDFKQAFEAMADTDDEGRWNPIYFTRDVKDENVVLTFGMFQGSLDELRNAQQSGNYDEQLERISHHVDEVLLDGAYEVQEEFKS